MNRPDYIPGDYQAIQIAETRDDVIWPIFENGVNCWLLPGALSVNFTPLARHLTCVQKGRMRDLTIEDLQKQISSKHRRMSKPARLAAEYALEEDMMPLSRRFRNIILRSVRNYTHQPLVHVPHDDVNDLYMRAYTNPAMRVVRSDRAALKKTVSINELSFSLYDTAPNADIPLHAGDSWHQAGNRSADNPLIHYGPRVPEDAPLRLMLICNTLK